MAHLILLSGFFALYLTGALWRLVHVSFEPLRPRDFKALRRHRPSFNARARGVFLKN
jgi:hypothetical protein